MIFKRIIVVIGLTVMVGCTSMQQREPANDPYLVRIRELEARLAKIEQAGSPAVLAATPDAQSNSGAANAPMTAAQANVELLQIAQQQKTEIRRLQGTLEEERYQSQQALAAKDAEIAKLRTQLGAVASAVAPVAEPVPVVTTVAPPVVVQPATTVTTPVVVPATSSTPATAVATVQEVVRPAASSTVSEPVVITPNAEVPTVAMRTPGSTDSTTLEMGGERDRYRAAYEALQSQRYGLAISGFADFVSKYPRSEYADNAQYWLGETYYVTRDFDKALVEFSKVETNYSSSSKVPDAKLKVGYIYYEQRQWSLARLALESVVRDFSTSRAAELAKNRLERMDRESR